MGWIVRIAIPHPDMENARLNQINVYFCYGPVNWQYPHEWGCVYTAEMDATGTWLPPAIAEVVEDNAAARGCQNDRKGLLMRRWNPTLSDKFDTDC